MHRAHARATTTNTRSAFAIPIDSSHQWRSSSANGSALASLLTVLPIDKGLNSTPSGLESAGWPAARSRSPTSAEKHEPNSSSGLAWPRVGKHRRTPIS
eukprot:7383934-Prymnesium_polylepis.1